MWTAPEIEQCRLESIVDAWHLIGSRRAPLNTPSEWNGWQVVNPDGNRQRYAERAAAKRCTRCGKDPPRPDRKLCARCSVAALARSAALRERRKAAAICLDCRRPTTGGHVRCAGCRATEAAP